MYVPSPYIRDNTPENLLKYMQDELEAISRDQGQTLALELRPVFAAPTKPREGMIVWADGTSWNPGYGAGPYTYKAGAWSFIGFQSIPQNSKSAAYTTVLSDAGKHILHPLADNNARTFTIDSNANVPYPIGTFIYFVNLINTVTIAITSDTLLFSPSGGTGSRTLAANGNAKALKIETTKWMISGFGIT